ncbi:MAG TPA: tripartite tricarboxylate transporter substrate-binding protein [Vicinamibacterales bacterium]|nr:tripartite tricarboxylate transporter substrate-binding protein [Vicinamibacterales bacterium]
MRIALVLLIALPELTSGAAPPASQDRTLIITAPAAPGGGWDQTARAMQRVLAEIEPGVSVQVDNVPGAAGTIGLARFAQSERGNPNAILVTGLVMVSGVILNGSPVSLGDTTAIARLTGEHEIIVVPAASPFRTIGDLVSAFRADPGLISWGGGSAGGTDDLLIRLLAEQIGLPASSVNYVAFPGGGAALAAVLGGQVTAAVSGFAEFAGQIAAGQLRILAVSAPARVAGIDAPTLREAGIGLDLANWRAVVGPPGLTDAEQAAMVERITRLAQSPQWQATLRQNGWDDQFLAGAAFRQFLLAEQSRIEDVLRRLTATDASHSTRTSVILAPTTVPALAIAVLLIVAIVVGARLVRDPPSFDRQGLRMCAAIAASLILLPLMFVTAGFVIASTLLFGAVATTLRGHLSARSVAIDLVVGAAFVTLLFSVFTRALGVALPGLPF